MNVTQKLKFPVLDRIVRKTEKDDLPVYKYFFFSFIIFFFHICLLLLLLLLLVFETGYSLVNGQF